MLTLTQSKPKLLMAASAVVLIILLVFVIAAKSIVSKKAKPAPSLTPEVVIPPKSERAKIAPTVKEIRQKIIESKIAIRGGDVYLVSNDKYKIIYVPTPDMFFVTIGKEPVDQSKKEAQSWFLKFGLKPQDLCTLPVRFFLENYQLKKDHPNFNILPEGCK